MIENHSLTRPMSKSRQLTFVNVLLPWANPIPAAVLATILFLGFAMLGPLPAWGTSHAAYFNYLADAFLHGQLYLRVLPENHLDLSFFQGRYYLYWGPLPAILMMPVVVLFGIGASDILFSVVTGGVIAGLVAELLRQINRCGWITLTPVQRALVVVFFTLGTAMTPLPAISQVWYLHSLVALAFALLAYITAFAFEGKQAFFWTGIAVAAVLATRLSAGFIAIFPAWYLLRTYWTQGFRRVAINCIVGILPVVAVLGLLMAYNAARFGNPLETGINYHLMSDKFRLLYNQYGYLSLHFLPVNFYYNYIDYPLADLFVLQTDRLYGGSLFLLSPLFFAAFYGLWVERKNWDTWILLAAILLGNIPVLLVMGPGSIHYGPRYALDFIIPLLLLTMLGMQRWPVRRIAFLVGLSVLQYLPGAILIGLTG